MSIENKKFDPNNYYNEGYFAGSNPDSPYPKDAHYLNTGHPEIRRKFNNLYQVVTSRNPIRIENKLKLLDVGCGPANTEIVFTEIDKNIEVYNCDGFFPVAAFAKNVRKASRVATADQRKLPFADASFGGVSSWDVIEHVLQSESAIFFKEANRVLVPGGVLAIRTPNKWTWTGKYRKDVSHVWFPTTGIIRQMLKEAGFSDLKITTRGFPGTRIYEALNPDGDLYLPFGGGVIIASAIKPG
ncbi:MAG: class I SAM-dependent methyltransferase [Desulfobacteraceae bacterium]|jgi:SAM-dependent methyltransferase